MWHSPIMNALPYQPFMAPPIGLNYPTYPISPWLNLTRQMNTQQTIFWPQVNNRSIEPQQTIHNVHMAPISSLEEINFRQNILLYQPYNMGFGMAPITFPPPRNISETPKKTLDDNKMKPVKQKPFPPAVGVLEAEVAKVNQAMLQRDNHSRYIKHSQPSPPTDISPRGQSTPLRNDQIESDKSHLPFRRVHSPPILGSCLAIPSPNAASTPVKPSEQNQKPGPRSNNTDKLTVQESITETADIKTELEFELHPLDLRVRKRCAEDCDPECHRNDKKCKTEHFLNIQTLRKNSTCESNVEAKLNSYNKQIDSESDSLDKRYTKRESLGSEEKSVKETSVGKRKKAQRCPNPSNVSSMYLSSGYDSGVVLDTTESVNAHEENLLQVKSGVYGIFCCQSCDYKTFENLAAKGHLKEHCGHVVKQKCTICEKDFSFSEGIARHVLQSHQSYDTRALKSFLPNCNDAFSQDKLLNVYLRFDHGEKYYKCLQSGCGKSFSTKSTLKHHQFVHTDIFKCTWTGCGKRFRDDYNLRTHFMIHTGKKPRQCPQCDYSCVQKNSMDWHMKTKHK